MTTDAPDRVGLSRTAPPLAFPGVREVAFPEVFERAMAGVPCVATGDESGPELLPMARWVSAADASDDVLLALCDGPTLDVGCGPGRLTERLADLGHVTLGVDVVEGAVRRTRSRGVSAVQRDVFERLPGEGRWRTVLLADGNIGIGGDPVTLLRRVSELLTEGGRIVVEVDRPGIGLRRHVARLRCGDIQSRPFTWGVVGADVVDELAEEVGFTVEGLHPTPDRAATRWFAVLAPLKGSA